MEGLTFYWVSWVLWVIITFLLNKNQVLRLPLSIGLLLVIISSSFSIELGGIKVTFASVLLLLTLYILVGRLSKPKMAYALICHLIILLAYVSFLLFELFDPVWVIFDRKWMLSILLVYLAIMLHENRLMRVVIILMGAVNGEVLYALIISKFSFPHTVGSLMSLDAIALSVAFVAIWNALEYSASYFEVHLNQLEKEKQNYHE
ncbi:YphA family membrane protein [Cytobacillus purgationiresistens]|uniref:Uncharacterized protein n=1 Tax=Cytobacillus purgationiresistens TaxID=863449 RepID=A0ABU0AIK8_9BACI|nr:hypothetical protein [Cytobacillus purgationiresistens]MDQ0271094.1 hypothetical protein [Cytobacillus purgationiresistens]